MTNSRQNIKPLERDHKPEPEAIHTSKKENTCAEITMTRALSMPMGQETLKQRDRLVGLKVRSESGPLRKAENGAGKCPREGSPGPEA